jgi:hypothetical protein
MYLVSIGPSGLYDYLFPHTQNNIVFHVPPSVSIHRTEFELVVCMLKNLQTDMFILFCITCRGYISQNNQNQE